jgi:sulfoxide reductase heme-binding subunit YedZ
MAVMNDALWYLGRGAGLMSLVLLTVTVALGVASRSGQPLAGLPRFAVSAVHRNAALLSVSLLAVHVLTLLFDPYAQLKVVDLVVPFLGAYQPVWLGLGTLALDAVLAIVVTSLLRARLGVRAWRAVHWLAYAAWPFAFLHSLWVGTDASEPWLLATAVTCAAVIAAGVVWRFAIPSGLDSAR